MSAILYMVITVITLVHSIPTKPCQRIKVGDQWYDRDIIWANLGRPHALNVHKSTNTLFFTYTLAETYSDADFQLAFLDLNNRNYQMIAGIKGGCSIAINQDQDEVYLGGTDGIFKYNVMTRIADAYKEAGQNIWSLFFKRNLFYINYPNQKLHIEIDGKFSVVREFEQFEVDQFHVTNNNEIFFSNKTGFYKFDNVNLKSDVISELLTVRQIAEDNEDRLFVCTNVGVLVDAKLEGFKKIIDMRNIYGIAFDKDNNLILSDERSIIRLKYSTAGCDELRSW